MSIISNFKFIISNQYKKIHSRIYGIGNWKLEIGNSLAEGGFTLIELLVVILILSTLIVGVVIYINPTKQLNKVKDARRKQDSEQIKNALDVYYNDHNCYPTSLRFGSRWREGSVTYMSKVPQDPDCSSNGENCYRYQVPGGVVCPQWNVLYTRTVGGVSGGTSTACPLAESCLPQDDMSSWSCEISGKVNCNIISNNEIPTFLESTEGPTPPQGSSSTCPSQSYICPANGGCNVGNSGVGPTFCTLEECESAKAAGEC